MNFNQISLRYKLIVITLLVILSFFIVPTIFRATAPIVNKILGWSNTTLLEDYKPIGSIEIYDYRDNFVGVLQGKEDRQVIKLDQVSDYLKKAVLAIEDSDFYHHGGFSIIGLFRAFTTNLKAGKIVQGGSTITQQLVKNLFIKEEERYKKSIFRKIKELMIAVEIEEKYDKDKILEIYLNQVYFGNRAYGIERASQRYFSKHASKLTIEEAAFLGGLLTAPSYLAGNLDKAIERQQQVLKRMNENGYITDAEYKKAIKTKLKLKKSSGNLSVFPHYFSFIEQGLKKRFTRDEMRKGLKVYTGMDPEAQRLAIQALNLGIKNAAHGINQGALVSLDVESGEVRAMVGGVGDFWNSQYNRAVNVHTVGSAFKPFVYLTAFMKGVVDPTSIVLDEKLEIKDISAEDQIWSPKNFDDEFHGPISARAALVFSRNIPAIRVAMKAGVKNIIKTARSAGIKSPLEPVLSLALGSQAISPRELATAYSTFARGGVYMDSIVIRKITDMEGHVLEKNRAMPKNSLPEKEVAQLVEIMQDVVRFGTGALANIPGRVIAGKTGTADGSRDIWFTGFTPDIVTTVWAGNEQNKEVFSKYATGGGTTAWIWKEFMSNYYKAKPKPPKGFAFSNNFVTALIDPLTGLLATEYTPHPVLKRFTPGTEPKRYAPTPEGEKIITRKTKRRRTFLKANKHKGSDEEKIKTITREREYEKRIKTIEKVDKYKKKLQKPKPKPKPFKISSSQKQAGE